MSRVNKVNQNYRQKERQQNPMYTRTDMEYIYKQAQQALYHIYTVYGEYVRLSQMHDLIIKESLKYYLAHPWINVIDTIGKDPDKYLVSRHQFLRFRGAFKKCYTIKWPKDNLV